eukprot:CFRG7729T1
MTKLFTLRSAYASAARQHLSVTPVFRTSSILRSTGTVASQPSNNCVQNSVNTTPTQTNSKTQPFSTKTEFKHDFDNVAADSLFQVAWGSLETKLGRENMIFPKEIMWLGGAPGSGKSTHTRFIMRERGITAPPIVVSDLLNSPEALAIKATGGLVSDREVVSALFAKMLEPKYESGVVIDGFPRTSAQAEIVHDLHKELLKLNCEYPAVCAHPIFRIAVVYIDEQESIKRQLQRGKENKEHNLQVKKSNAAGKDNAKMASNFMDASATDLLEERSTDYDPALAAKRYATFKNETFAALESLGNHFIYNFVSSMGPIPETEKNIKKEMEYQSGLELREDTFKLIHNLPRVDEVSIRARQNLVRALDTAQAQDGELFTSVVGVLETHVYPHITANALHGRCYIDMSSAGHYGKMEAILPSAKEKEIALNVLADRGFQCWIRNHGRETSEMEIRWQAPKLRRALLD